MLTTIDFLSNVVDFQSSEQLTGQICDARIETWHEHYWGPIMNHKVIWSIINPIFLEKTETLVIDQYLRGDLTSQLLSGFEYLRTLEECLEENGRANFGVQHHAFFNKYSLRFKPHHWRYFEVISSQCLLWFIMPKVVKDSSKIVYWRGLT